MVKYTKGEHPRNLQFVHFLHHHFMDVFDKLQKKRTEEFIDFLLYTFQKFPASASHRISSRDIVIRQI